MNAKTRQEIVAALTKAGRRDLAGIIEAAAPKPADLRKSWQTLFRQVKQVQRSGVALESQKAAEIAALLQKVSRAIQVLEKA